MSRTVRSVDPAATGARSYRLWAALVAVAAVIATGAWLAMRAHRVAPQASPPASSSARGAVAAPARPRIQVQVLNATAIRGLGRRATLHLRDRGFDVVETGTTQPVRDSTLVLDRSGHPQWARAVAEAMGGARVESRPDSSRYLDVTVLIGASWRPPSEPFYP